MTHARAVWSAAIVAGCALVAVRAQAQTDAFRPAAMVPVREVVPADAGIEAEPAIGPVTALHVDGGAQVLPLAEPVEDWSVGLLPDGGRVLLVGGVRSGLAVYVVDASGRPARWPFVTDGGRRLAEQSGPVETSGGTGPDLSQGSWPLVDADGLLYLAYESASGLSFRVLDAACNVLRAFDTDLRARGFRVFADPRSHRVRVQFVGDAPAPVHEFLHPNAPRLQLDVRTLELEAPAIGGMASGQVSLRNPGARDLELRVSVTGTSFYLGGGDGADRVTVPAGGSREVALEFAPEGIDAERGRLVLESDVPGVAAQLELRGVVLTSPAPIEPPATDAREPPTAAAAGGKAESGGPARTAVTSAVANGRDERASPEGAADGTVGVESAPPPVEPDSPPRPVPTLATRDLAALRVVRAGETVRVVGRVDALAGLEDRVEVAVRRGGRSDERVPARLDADGSVRGELSAVAGDRVELVVIESRSRRPTTYAIGRVLPALDTVPTGDEVVVRGRADDVVLVLAVRADARGRSRRVLRSWRCRLDGYGVARLGAAAFSEVEGDALLRAVAIDDAGDLVESNSVAVTALRRGHSRRTGR